MRISGITIPDEKERYRKNHYPPTINPKVNYDI